MIMVRAAIRSAHNLACLVDDVQAVTAVRADRATTADPVTEELRTHRPSPGILTAEQRCGIGGPPTVTRDFLAAGLITS
ncbi:hypothetical protein [Microlunatus speluncae]|uniref:hypothetical protein n=1 Tax=Microlunatus speluncae TaxID=2594267 RepID=UPI0012663A1E|nr:hypothetical protein [Microlunatus speluncae]